MTYIARPYVLGGESSSLPSPVKGFLESFSSLESSEQKMWFCAIWIKLTWLDLLWSPHAESTGKGDWWSVGRCVDMCLALFIQRTCTEHFAPVSSSPLSQSHRAAYSHLGAAGAAHSPEPLLEKYGRPCARIFWVYYNKSNICIALAIVGCHSVMMMLYCNWYQTDFFGHLAAVEISYVHMTFG